MAQNKNNGERDIRRREDGSLWDYTETHNNKYGGINNKRPKRISGGQSNKRKVTHYEPSKLFNVLAGGALLAVLTIGGFNTLADIVKSGIDAKNNIEDVKDTITDVKEALSDQSTAKSQYNVTNFLEFDIDEEKVQECIENVYSQLSNNDVDAIVDDVIIVDYEEANTVKKYEENVLKRIANKESTVTVILISNDTLDNDSAMERYNKCNDMVMNNTDLIETSFSGVMVTGVSNVPYNMNMAIVITYYYSNK